MEPAVDKKAGATGQLPETPVPLKGELVDLMARATPAHLGAARAVLSKSSDPILGELSQLGVTVIPAQIWEKLGRADFNPAPLKQADLDWYNALTPELRKLVAAVPMKGNVDANDVGVAANAAAKQDKIVAVAEIDSDPQKLGKTPSGDRYKLILMEAIPGTVGIEPGEMQSHYPAGVEAINPAVAYIADTLIRLHTRNSETYFTKAWVRTSSPRLVVGGHYGYRTVAREVGPVKQYNVGAGVSRISE